MNFLTGRGSITSERHIFFWSSLFAFLLLSWILTYSYFQSWVSSFLSPKGSFISTNSSSNDINDNEKCLLYTVLFFSKFRIAFLFLDETTRKRKLCYAGKRERKRNHLFRDEETLVLLPKRMSSRILSLTKIVFLFRRSGPQSFSLRQTSSGYGENLISLFWWSCRCHRPHPLSILMIISSLLTEANRRWQEWHKWLACKTMATKVTAGDNNRGN